MQNRSRPLSSQPLAGVPKDDIVVHISWSSWSIVSRTCNHRGPAIYQIRVISDRIPMAIPRFLARDASGLVSIGMSSNMESRRRSFNRALRRGRGHSEGNLLYILDSYSNFDTWLRDSQLQYRYAVMEYSARAKEIEEVLLKSYFLRFGEVPPLNSAIPKRYDWPSWQAIQSQPSNDAS